MRITESRLWSSCGRLGLDASAVGKSLALDMIAETTLYEQLSVLTLGNVEVQQNHREVVQKVI